MKKELRFILIILSASILFGCGIPFIENPYSIIYVHLIALLGIILCLIFVVIGVFKNRKVLYQGLVGILFITFFIGSGFFLNNYLVNSKKEKATNIVDKIEKYKSKNGFYPKALSDLRVENDINDLKYIYNDSLKKFILSYPEKSMTIYYDSDGKYWGNFEN